MDNPDHNENERLFDWDYAVENPSLFTPKQALNAWGYHAARSDKGVYDLTLLDALRTVLDDSKITSVDDENERNSALQAIKRARAFIAPDNVFQDTSGLGFSDIMQESVNITRSIVCMKTDAVKLSAPDRKLSKAEKRELASIKDHIFSLSALPYEQTVQPIDVYWHTLRVKRDKEIDNTARQITYNERLIKTEIEKVKALGLIQHPQHDGGPLRALFGISGQNKYDKALRDMAVERLVEMETAKIKIFYSELMAHDILGPRLGFDHPHIIRQRELDRQIARREEQERLARAARIQSGQQNPC